MNPCPEFIRGNQKNYIRMICNYEVTKSYEYQMCTNNILNSFLEFQERSHNGEDYLYFEISGMQSLDIYLQSRKLRRDFMILLAKGILKLCKELSEYALDIQRVVLEPKYIMVAPDTEGIKFLYSFQESAEEQNGLERFLECCIEHLDYQDETLVNSLYAIYERLLDQQQNFSLSGEMERLLEALTEIEIVQIEPELIQSKQQEGLEPVNLREEKKFVRSNILAREKKSLKKGLWIFLLCDVLLLIFWKPITLLKLFFEMAMGCTLLGLIFNVMRQEKKRKSTVAEPSNCSEYLEEYQELVQSCDTNIEGTRIVDIRESESVLYNLQNIEPQYIYIGSERKIIGKDAGRVQVCIAHESVSRMHAMVVKEGENCIIEDLNSTNGTRVNNVLLKPRTPHVLKQGDKVLIAGLEYIFR